MWFIQNMGNSSSGALTKKEAEELVQARMSSYRHPMLLPVLTFFSTSANPVQPSQDL
jgi:hypothetical protein